MEKRKAGRPRTVRSNIDFKGFKYEKLITMTRKERVLDFYPQLKKYPELDSKKYKKMKIAFDKVLRYVMMYYTKNALRDVIPEMPRRKKEAALIAGFEINKETGKFHKEIEQMMLCENELVNQLIVRFIRRSENKKFAQLCVFEEARAKQMQKLLDGVGDRDKELTKVVVENVKSLSDDIEDLEADLLNEDESVDLLELMYNEVDYSNLGISPEEIAQAKEDDAIGNVLKAPYKQESDGLKRM